jgi:sugar lactone lactonase YvrE
MIRKIVIATGEVTILAGYTTLGSANGTGISASFRYPGGIATDGTNLYVADTGNNMIRKIVIRTAAVTTLAGSTYAGSADGTGTSARFRDLLGLATDGVNLYVADTGNNMIRRVE